MPEQKTEVSKQVRIRLLTMYRMNVGRWSEQNPRMKTADREVSEKNGKRGENALAPGTV